MISTATCGTRWKPIEQVKKRLWVLQIWDVWFWFSVLEVDRGTRWGPATGWTWWPFCNLCCCDSGCASWVWCTDLSALAVSISELCPVMYKSIGILLENGCLRTGRLPLKTRAWGGGIFFFRLYGFVYASTIRSNSTLMLLFIPKNFFFWY